MDLAGRVGEISRAFSGTLGIAAINLTTGERFGHHAEMSFTPASTIKLPILHEIFKGAGEGRWSLDDKVTLTGENQVQGSGVLLDLTPGLQLSIRDAAMLMIVVSDNTATNMLVDVSGVEPVNRSMSELGLTTLRLNRKIGREMEIPLGIATPRDMARLMELIARHQSPSPQGCLEMVEILKRQKYKENTNRFIPETDSEDDDPPIRIASKSGWVRGVRNDVALIWSPRSTYVLSMFSRDCKDRRFYWDNEGSITLARVSQVFYEVWGR